MNPVQGFPRVSVVRYVFKFSAESQKISLLKFGLLEPTKTLGCRRYVLHCPLNKPTNNERKRKVLKKQTVNDRPPGGTPILGHIRDVRPEWVTFPGRKPADGCKFLTKNLRMGHNFDVILPGNGWFSSKLNKTYCSLVNFYCK